MMRTKNIQTIQARPKGGPSSKVKVNHDAILCVLIYFVAPKLPSALTHASSSEHDSLFERVDTKTPWTREAADGTPAGIPEVSSSFLYTKRKKKNARYFCPHPRGGLMSVSAQGHRARMCAHGATHTDRLQRAGSTCLYETKWRWFRWGSCVFFISNLLHSPPASAVFYSSKATKRAAGRWRIEARSQIDA